MVNLKDFVNGQAWADVAAWRVEGRQEGGAASCHRNTRRMAVGRRAVFSRK